ncbi:hypothetical protein FB451DRAFT_1394410 [Mycena latifolia]|nr:hypothetical protein FB451DRAFT_1394410 [Mycena latifolia]
MELSSIADFVTSALGYLFNGKFWLGLIAVFCLSKWMFIPWLKLRAGWGELKALKEQEEGKRILSKEEKDVFETALNAYDRAGAGASKLYANSYSLKGRARNFFTAAYLFEYYRNWRAKREIDKALTYLALPSYVKARQTSRST